MLPSIRCATSAGLARGELSLDLVSAPSLGVRSVGDLIALRKAPGAAHLRLGRIGGGGTSRASSSSSRGIDAVHVPYKGMPEPWPIPFRRIQYTFSAPGPAIRLIWTAGSLALGVGSAQRSPLLPQVPTWRRRIARLRV